MNLPTPSFTAPAIARRLLRALRAPVLPVLMGALNHVLAQQGWARERLLGFAGRRVRLALDPQGLAAWAPPLDVVVTADGLLSASPPVSEDEAVRVPPDVCLWWRLSPDLLGGLVAGRPPAEALAPFLRVEGDVPLATVLGELAGNLRWDAEDDLGRLLGDLPARRLGLGARHLHEQALSFGRRLEEGAGRLLTTGEPPLAGGVAVAGLRAEIEALQDRVERLAVRVRQVEAGRPAPRRSRGA